LYDVAVVGGGPAGSQVTYRLVSMGHRVVVIEQKEWLGEPVCCTGIIGQDCVSAFAVDEKVILRQAKSARIFSPSGKVLRLWREEPQACIVDRAALNLALADRAQAGGAEYVLNCRVSGIEVGADRVRVKAAGRSGEESVFEARAAVIATGFGSKLMEGLGRAGDFVGGAQAEVELRGVDEVEVYLGGKIAPGFFGWLVPTQVGQGLVGLLSRHRPGFYLKELLSSLVAAGKVTSDKVGFSYGAIPLKPLARTYRERLLVVGTAAGQVKPTTGGGIYYGLLCADLAAETLHRALERDDLSVASLARYEKEWKKRLGWELRTGYWARRLYERLGDEQIDAIFDIIERERIDEALLKADDLSFDWHGRVVLRLIRHLTLSRAIAGMKLPISLKRD